ncbi:hypothetical protein C5S29_06315 [ANME-1 cluster archaeon GoMg3.2]|nr:hypothetical protein [ANME-1 cluster archaeon GoMg3.2]
MGKSDYPKVHRRGVAVMVILLLLFGAFAPVAMAGVWPRCHFDDSTACTANDCTITDVWLVANPDCTPGTSISAELWVKFWINRHQGVCCVVSVVDVYVDGELSEANKTANLGNLFPGSTSYERKIADVTWICGSELALKNIYVQWIEKGGTPCPTCTYNDCSDYNKPKCYKDLGPYIVRAPLIANFTFDNVCFCTSTTFTDKTTGGNGSYIYDWDFDDGTSHSTDQNPTHHYGKNGTYNVNLTVTDSNTTPNTDSQIYAVEVYQKPIANFTSNSPQIYCYNITFNGSATDGTPPYTYYWDFDDVNTSTEQNTSHRYSAPGTYDVTLTVTDTNGCTNSTTKPVVASGYTAGLAITKEANVTSATVGTVIGYTINVSNTGTANLKDVLVTDSLTGLNETIPILAHGATQTFNTNHTVTEPEICAPINNTATANGTDPCGNPVGPATASVIVTQGYTTGLAVVKTTNVTMPTVGTVIWYTINVSNTGNVNLSSVLVMDKLTGLNETMTILAPGSFHIFNTTYTVTESDICELIENRATANGTDPCGYLTPTAVGVLGIRPWYTATLSVIKEANVTSATVGTVIGYTINVSNAGNVNLTSVLVTDNITGLNETIPLLAPGATQIFNTTYTVTELDICGWI